MSTGNPILETAICKAIKETLDSSIDRLIRVDLPASWPVAGAIESLVLKNPDSINLGVMGPFQAVDFDLLKKSPTKVTISLEPDEMTRWRDPSSESPPVPTILCGSAEGDLESGLKELSDKSIVGEDSILNIWKIGLKAHFNSINKSASSVIETLTELLGPPDHQIDVCDFNQYIKAVLAHSGDPDKLLEEQRNSLWMLHLVPDHKLHNAGSGGSFLSERIKTNCDLISDLRTSSKTDFNQSILQKQGKSNATAVCLLKYCESSPPDETELKTLDFDAVETLLKSRNNTPKDSSKPQEFDFYQALDVLTAVGRKKFLRDIGDQWSKTWAKSSRNKSAEIPLSHTPDPADVVGKITKLEVKIDDISKIDKDWDCLWTDGDAADQVICVWLKKKPENRLGVMAGEQKLKVQAKTLLEDFSIKSPSFHPHVESLILARKKLYLYSKQLVSNQFFTLLLNDAARSAVEEYKNSWAELTSLMEEEGLEDPKAPFDKLALLDIALFEEGDDNQRYCVLGYLHPYTLFPNLALAQHVLEALPSSETCLGEQLNWALDNELTPLANVIPIAEKPGKPGENYSYICHSAVDGTDPPLLTYSLKQSDSRLSTAEGGSGLIEVVNGLNNLHAYTKNGLRILLVNPPSGKAIEKNLRRIINELQPTKPQIEIGIVGDTGESLAIDGKERSIEQKEAFESHTNMLGRFAELKKLLEVASPAHIAIFFQPIKEPQRNANEDLPEYFHFGVEEDSHFDESTEIVLKIRNHADKFCKTLHDLTGCKLQSEAIKDTTEQQELQNHQAELKDHCEWVGVGSPDLLKCPLPARSGSGTNYLGRTQLGRYRIHWEFRDKEAIWSRIGPEVDEGPWKLTEHEVLKILDGSLLRILRTKKGANCLDEELGLGVARKLAKEVLRKRGFDHFIEVDIDDLSWSRAWLSGPPSKSKSKDLDDRGYRCDRLYVGIQTDPAADPSACILSVESKCGYSGCSTMDITANPWKKAAKQVQKTNSAITDLLDERNATNRNLIDKIRLQHLAAHLSSRILAKMDHFDSLNLDQRKLFYEGTLNPLLDGRLDPANVQVGTLCVLTRPGDTSKTGSATHTYPASDDQPPLTLVLCERETLAEEFDSEFIDKVSADLFAPLSEIKSSDLTSDSESDPEDKSAGVSETTPSESVIDAPSRDGSPESQPNGPPESTPSTEVVPTSGETSSIDSSASSSGDQSGSLDNDDVSEVSTPTSDSDDNLDSQPRPISIALGNEDGNVELPVFWKPEDTDTRINPHMVILGGSGSGKTQTLKSLIYGLCKQNVPVLTLDFKDDYCDEKFHAQVGAKLFEADTGLPINPLVPEPDSIGKQIRLKNQKLRVSGTLKKIYGLGPIQTRHLEQAIEATYVELGLSMEPHPIDDTATYPDFSRILHHLENTNDPSLIARLDPLFDLSLFANNGNALSAFFEKSTIVRLSQLPTEEVKKAAAEFLLMGVYQYLMSRGHTKNKIRLVIVIDEAHRIADLDATERLLREARAFGCAIFLSSQNPADFSDNVYNQTATSICLKLNDEKSAKVAATHVCESKERGKQIAADLRSLNTFDGILHNSQYPTTYLRLTPYFEQVESDNS